MTDDAIRQAALAYHRCLPPGKIQIVPTKPLTTQDHLALAYSPGVSYACQAILVDPSAAGQLTAKDNLVAIITNGTAVLGLGNIGPLAAKPVMEGKAVLFKKFAAIDAIDLEIDETDPMQLVHIIASLAPSVGGINLEDIKAPECFVIEQALQRALTIPVFHDDQHGTAIVVAAAVINALQIVGKSLRTIRVVSTGMGAAGIAALELLVQLGLDPANLFTFDHDGFIYLGRESLDKSKQPFAQHRQPITLEQAFGQADLFLGLSVGNLVTPAMVATMAQHPILFALANPTPEILPETVRSVRQDAIIGTGRSDYPNQINNALCFPYLFRGALDVKARLINNAMKIACVQALAQLAQDQTPHNPHQTFGPDYLIPTLLDQRLLPVLASTVAQAAMATGVAQQPIDDINAYRQRWQRLR